MTRWANVELVVRSWHPMHMKNAETVTFGGSGLDRAAHLRPLANQLAADPAARAIVLWRGKVLCDENTNLARLSLSDNCLVGSVVDPIFLGQDGDVPLFAVDISEWQPDGFDLSEPVPFLDDSRQSHPAHPDLSFADIRATMTLMSARDAELAATAKAVMEWHRNHGFCARCGQPSAITMGGWQRDCAACDTKHFPRTDPVVIMLITHGNNVLVGRSPGWPEGMYSLLAGFIEPGETIEAAVRREVFEESGVQVGDVTYLASQPWPFPASLMLGCAGEALSEQITIDPDEIEDAQWISREDMARVFVGQHPTINPTRKGAIAHFLLEKWLADCLV